MPKRKTPRATIRLSDDARPGITRRRCGRGWQYFDASGARIADRDEIDRLNAIGLPPAYRDCWFCPDPGGHIQAIGYDERGRKQYRYHPRFTARRDRQKYRRLAAFGRALAKLRRRVEADLAGKTTSPEAVTAAVVRLIDETYMRVGNEDYARENRSFGATTLLRRHVRIARGTATIRFAGKHGIVHVVEVIDRRLARVLARMRELPGARLFEYVDAAGEARPVGSAEVNAYIRVASGGDFTAKDFRTWGASVIAYAALATRAKGLRAVLAPVAEALGNTPAIARKSYVHPALVELAKAKAGERLPPLPRRTRYLSRAERGPLAFLEGAA